MTMSDKEFSDLSAIREECPTCGALWLNGRHIWAGTCKMTHNSEFDLAGLVCNTYGDERCINRFKGREGGMTWEKRLEALNVAMMRLET